MKKRLLLLFSVKFSIAEDFPYEEPDTEVECQNVRTVQPIVYVKIEQLLFVTRNPKTVNNIIIMVMWSDQWFLFYIYSTQVVGGLRCDAAAAKVIQR